MPQRIAAVHEKEKEKDSSGSLHNSGAGATSLTSSEEAIEPVNPAPENEGSLSHSSGLKRLRPTSSKWFSGSFSDQLDHIEKMKYKQAKRNNQVNSLFKEYFEGEETWITDLSCAMENKKKIMCHGRMWVTKNYICFYSNIFGFVTKEAFSLGKVQSLVKDVHGFINPSINLIVSSDGEKPEKYIFASFLSRDSTYTKLLTIWQAYRNNEDIAALDLISPVASPQNNRSTDPSKSASGGITYTNDVKSPPEAPKAIPIPIPMPTPTPTPAPTPTPKSRPISTFMMMPLLAISLVLFGLTVHLLMLNLQVNQLLDSNKKL